MYHFCVYIGAYTHPEEAFKGRYSNCDYIYEDIK